LLQLDEPTMGGRRTVGTIWNVVAGDPSSRPERNDNTGNPHKLINPHSLSGSSV